MGTPYSSRAPAVNTAAVVTVKGREGYRACVESAEVSYNAAPAGGNLTIVGANSNRAIDLDITAAGPQTWSFGRYGAQYAVGEDVVATLAAAGAAVTGKVNLVVYWQEDTGEYQF